MLEMQGFHVTLTMCRSLDQLLLPHKVTFPQLTRSNMNTGMLASLCSSNLLEPAAHCVLVLFIAIYVAKWFCVEAK